MPDDRLTPKDHAAATALFRSEVIGSLARRELERGEMRAALRALSEQRFRPPGYQVTRTFSVPTLERWYYAYRRGGLAALVPERRSDRGRARDLPEAVRALLLDIRREHPAASVPLILRMLVADGRLAGGAVAAATIARLYREHGLDRAALAQASRDGKSRLRWQAERPGALARLRSLRLRSVQVRRIDLSGGRWKRVGPYRYRYDWHLHEGDASFEYSASVRLRCPGGRAIEIPLDDDELEQGEHAVLFVADGAPVVALSVQGIDGGEGTEYPTVDMMVIEPAARCEAMRPGD